MSTTQSSPEPAPRRRLPAWTGNFGWQIVAALVLGLVLGLVARSMGHTPDSPTWLGETLATIGSVYISILKATVIPLVFFAVVASIANLAQVTNAARLAAKTLLWFAITSLIAVLIGLAVGVVMQPGVGTGQSAPESYQARDVGWLDFLTSMVPANFLGLTVKSTVGEDGAVVEAVGGGEGDRGPGGAVGVVAEVGGIAGAGLDVFEVEPPPVGQPLHALPNVIMAPHVAGVTVEAVDRMSEQTARNILSVLDGNPLRQNVINQDVLG